MRAEFYDPLILLNLITLIIFVPITVAAGSKAWTVFVRSNIGTMDLNPTRGMDVCVVYCMFVLFCAQIAALRQAYPPSK
jgi:hypothetical protein